MLRKRFKLRVAAVATLALLLGSLVAPSAALASEVSCGQNTCSCCCCCCDCADENGSIDGATDANEESTATDDSDTDVIADSNDAGSTTTEAANDTVADLPQTDSNALIRFNELLPNPVGTDTEGEFVELANVGTTSAIMDGWKIRNAGGKEYALPSGTLAGGDRLTLPYSITKITLTNSGMTLSLIGPDGALKDSVTYSSEAEEGMAYAKHGDSWFWTTTPTSGLANIITVNPATDGGSGSLDEEPSVVPAAEQPADSTEETPMAVEETPTTETEEIPTVIEIVINEFMPSPVGDDALGEWIELHNMGTAPADISGWLLDDAEGGSVTYALPVGTVIPADGYLVLERPVTKLSLNNDADAVRLFSPDATLVDSVTYDSATEGEALARNGIVWAWTPSPTPGEPNVVPNQDDETDEAEDEEEDTVTLSVEQAHSAADGTAVAVTGVVTMPLGVIGKTIFGFRDADTDYGATVRIYSSALPTLEVGDIVTVNGTVRQRETGELRIDASGPTPVSVIGSTTDIAAPEIRLAELDGTGAGLAVTVNGTVTDVGSDWFVLSDDSAEHEIKIQLPTGAVPSVLSGDAVSVRGVVRVERSVIALAVLDDSDVTDESSNEADTTGNETTTDAGTVAAETGDETGNGALPFLVVGALGASGVAYRGLKTRNGAARMKKAQ